MVVNSGIRQLDPAPLDSPVTYVMSEAAIAAEAFDETYQPTVIDQTSALPAVARAYGDGDDARWEQEWRDMFVDRDLCPPEPEACGVSDYHRWQQEMHLLTQQLNPGVDYQFRWRLRRPTGRGRWTGFFAANLSQPGIRIYNSYNRFDHVLRVDQGLGDRLNPHAWFACQRYQKPNVGLGAALQDFLFGLPEGSEDGRNPQFWGLLGGVASKSELIRQEYLWGSVGNHAGVIRQWAELAHWFPASSAPAGAQPIPRFADRNIDLSDVGGQQADGVSHSFIRAKPFADVWEAFMRFRDIFTE
jgi:hypothetical protein